MAQVRVRTSHEPSCALLVPSKIGNSEIVFRSGNSTDQGFRRCHSAHDDHDRHFTMGKQGRDEPLLSGGAARHKPVAAFIGATAGLVPETVAIRVTEAVLKIRESWD